MYKRLCSAVALSLFAVPVALSAGSLSVWDEKNGTPVQIYTGEAVTFAFTTKEPYKELELILRMGCGGCQGQAMLSTDVGKHISFDNDVLDAVDFNEGVPVPNLSFKSAKGFPARDYFVTVYPTNGTLWVIKQGEVQKTSDKIYHGLFMKTDKRDLVAARSSFYVIKDGSYQYKVIGR